MYISLIATVVVCTRGHGVAVVTRSPPTSEISGSNAGPCVGKLVVSYRWSAVYSTEPWPTVCTSFLCPQNYLSLYTSGSRGGSGGSNPPLEK